MTSCPLLLVHYSWLLSSWVKEFSYGTRTPAAGPVDRKRISSILPQTTRVSQAGNVPNANPSSVSPANSYQHLTWQGMLLVYSRVHMRGQTAQMSLLRPRHLSVTSTIHFSSNQTAEAAQAAREAERDKDKDARRDLVLVSWRC